MSGRVVDENLEIAPLVTIYDKDTTEIGKADLDGYFEIELPKETEKIIFAGLGYEWATITIPNDCKTPEIILFFEYTSSTSSLIVFPDDIKSIKITIF